MMKWMPALMMTMALSSSDSAAAETLFPEHFAHGATVDGTNGAPVQTFRVPLEVYRGVLRDDLGDLRVFNHKGEVVPHALRSLDAPGEKRVAPHALSFFELRGEPQRALDELSLHVERSSDGTIIDITEQPLPDAEPSRPLRAWILDAGADAESFAALEIDWAVPRENFVLRVFVHGSDDMSSWWPLGEGVVAHLERAGTAIDRRRIPLSTGASRARFIRMSWNGEMPFELTAASGTRRARKVEAQRARVRLDVMRSQDASGQYRFETGGPLPVDRIVIEPPDVNTFVTATVRSGSDPDGPWRSRYQGKLYRLAWQGEEISSMPMPVGGTAEAFWELQVDEAGGGLGSELPTVFAEWLPQQIVFVARGGGPFVVAYGSYRAEPAAFDLADLHGAIGQTDFDELAADASTLQDFRELAGASALVPPPQPVSWKRWALWAVLIVGVLMLGWMAWRLSRQLQTR